MTFKITLKYVSDGLLIFLKLLSGSIYGLFMVGAFSLLYLLLTQNGTALVITTATQFIPANVVIERIEGRLFDRVSLYGVAVDMPTGHYAAQQVSLDWRLSRLLIGQISIREVLLVNASATLPKKGAADRQGKAPISLDLTWLDDIRIRWPFTFSLENFDVSNAIIAMGDEQYRIEHFQMGTALTDGQFLLRTDQFNAVGADVDGSLRISGDRQGRLHFEGGFNWNYSGAPWPLAGELQVNGGIRQLNLIHQLNQPVQIKSNVELALINELPALTSRHHWSELCWPERAEDYCLNQGELTFDFNNRHFSTRLSTHVVAPVERPFPLVNSNDISVELHSTGEVDWDPLSIIAEVDYRLDSGLAGPLQVFKGTLAIEGKPTKLLVETALSSPFAVSFAGSAHQENTAWIAQGHLDLRDFNPDLIVPTLPGSLSAEVDLQGRVGDNDWKTEVHLKKLTGHLLDEPVSGAGEISVTKNQWVAKNVSLKSYGVDLRLNGKLNPNAEGKMELSLTVPDLQLYAPELAGSAQISAQLKGAVTRPELMFDGGIRALKTPAGEWDEVRLKGGGLLTDHRLMLDFTGEPSGSLSLTGHWHNGEWEGELQTLHVDSQHAGRWELSSPAQLHWSPAAWKTDPICFLTTENKVCAQGTGTAERAEGNFSVTWSDFRLLKPFLPDSLRIKTKLSALGNVRFTVSDGFAGTAYVSTDAGTLYWFSAEDGLLKLPIQLRNLKASVSSERVEGSYSLKVHNEEAAAGQFLLNAPPDSPFKYDTLSGDLRGSLAQFDSIQFFVPQIENMQGELLWDVAIAGSLTAPQVRGKVSYIDGRLSLPDLGQIDLPLSLDVDFDGSHLALLARTQSTDRGTLSLKGTADFPTLQEWRAQGELIGDTFLVLNTSEYQARITPDLKINAEPGTLRASGTLTIPSAQINFRGLPVGGITISNDVIVIRENQPPRARNILIADITAKAGDHVYFKGMGLDGRVTGSARYLRRANGLQEIFGDLGIRDGIYRAFGYNLEIERGTVIFAGSPTNPGLDIFAERRLLSGERIPVLISGSLQEPVLTLPQSSDQSQGDSFSKLLTGRNVGEDGQGDGILTDQISMIGVGLAENVTQGLAQSIGFDSGGLRADDGLDSTSLYLGKQVTERLFVGYGIGLVTPEQTVNLRLTLNKNWSVEATSGHEGGIDLIYNYETRAATTQSQKEEPSTAQ